VYQSVGFAIILGTFSLTPAFTQRSSSAVLTTLKTIQLSRAQAAPVRVQAGEGLQSKTARQVFQLFDGLASNEDTTLTRDRWTQLTAQYGFTQGRSGIPTWSLTADDGQVGFTIIVQPDATQYEIGFWPSQPERLPDPVLSWMLQSGTSSLTNGDMVEIQLLQDAVDMRKKAKRGIDRYVTVRISASGKLELTEVFITRPKVWPKAK
jgi:hypothetical protein